MGNSLNLILKMLSQLTASVKSSITKLVASKVASVYVHDETNIQYATLDTIDGLKGEKGEYKISSATSLQVDATENRSWDTNGPSRRTPVDLNSSKLLIS